MNEVEFTLRGEYIQLDALLKATGAASSGGVAKTMVLAAEVTVDGAVEMRRSRKLRAGSVVAVAGERWRLVDPASG